MCITSDHVNWIIIHLHTERDGQSRRCGTDNNGVRRRVSCVGGGGTKPERDWPAETFACLGALNGLLSVACVAGGGARKRHTAVPTVLGPSVGHHARRTVPFADCWHRVLEALGLPSIEIFLAQTGVCEALDSAETWPGPEGSIR